MYEFDRLRSDRAQACFGLKVQQRPGAFVPCQEQALECNVAWELLLPGLRMVGAFVYL